LPKIYWTPKLHKNPHKFRFIAGSRVCTTKKVSGILTKCLQIIKDKRIAYCKVIEKNSSINQMWILKNSKDLLEHFQKAQFSKAKCVSTWDFSTLYTSIPHAKLKKEIFGLIRGTMSNSRFDVMNCNSQKCFQGSASYDNYMSFTSDELCEMLHFLIDNIYVRFGNVVMRQVIGIPMGTDCAPLLADLFLHSYESTFLQKMMGNKTTYHIAKLFNRTDRYIDDLMSLDNPRFEEYVPQIYPKELILKKTNGTNEEAEYLDLLVNIDENGTIKTKLYDKRDDFNFDIVNFPFLDSNIPLGPAYGVYISQLIRYCRACCKYEDFKMRHEVLVTRLLSQGYQKHKLKTYFRKFAQNYENAINKYNIDLKQILIDVGLG